MPDCICDTDDSSRCDGSCTKGKLHDDGRESPEAHAYSRGFTAGNDLGVTEGAKVERERFAREIDERIGYWQVNTTPRAEDVFNVLTELLEVVEKGGPGMTHTERSLPPYVGFNCDFRRFAIGICILSWAVMFSLGPIELAVRWRLNPDD